MNKDKLIVAQVAFKGVIDLIVNDKVEINDVESTVDEFVNIIMKYQDQTFGNNLPKRNINTGQGMQGNASDKQKAFINTLIKEVESAGYQALSSDAKETVASPNLSKQDASNLIEILQNPTAHLQKVANETEVKAKPMPDTDDVAPF